MLRQLTFAGLALACLAVPVHATGFDEMFAPYSKAAASRWMRFAMLAS